MQKSFNFLFTYFTYNQKVQEIKTQLVNQLIYENVIDSTKLKNHLSHLNLQWYKYYTRDLVNALTSFATLVVSTADTTLVTIAVQLVEHIIVSMVTTGT